MKNRCFVAVIVLGILILCVGYGILREANQKKEMTQRMAEQKIVIMCIKERYTESAQLAGSFIDNSGDIYYFDVSEAFRDSNRRLVFYKNDTLYEYLCEHMEEYEKKPFLKKSQLYDCYASLNLIDKDAEMAGERAMADWGSLFLYGVRLSDNGEREFILLEEYGDWMGYNLDEHAQRTVEILGKDTWRDNFYCPILELY
ncbi:MAG: hypothetical protein K2O32_01940 [Acetatifactor sp.]|nr:hypothetical protein [Acetatifactor sp.]